MNVAIFLPGWIGDAVMATPAIRALRQRFARARFVAVVKPYVREVLGGSPWFDDVVLYHGGRWSQGVVATAYKLRRQRPDLAILFPNSFRAALAARLGGARRIVGYSRYGRSFLLSNSLETPRDPFGAPLVAPIVDAYNRLAESVGCSLPGHDLELFTTATDETAADGVWAAGRLDDYPELVCLNPGAAFGAAKHWPVDYFATLAGKLVDDRGCCVLVLCGPAERRLAQDIVAKAGRKEIFALGELAQHAGLGLSIGLTKACVRRADLLVTTDSGPRHFAHAFDRPVVTLFGPTHIGWTETYHLRSIHLQKQVPCGPCQQRVCPLDHRCMRELTPAEVFVAAESLLHGTV